MTDINSLNGREKHLLKKIHSYFIQFNRRDKIDETELQNLIIDEIPLGFTTPTILRMVNNGVLRQSPSPSAYGEIAYALTDTGLALADALVEADSLLVPAESQVDAEQQALAETIPASDRFVSRDDNTDAFEQTIGAIDELDRAVAGANGLTQGSAETDAIRAEIKSFRAWLDLPKVRAFALSAIQRGVQTLKNLAIKVEAKLVEQAADRVIALVMQLLTGG